MNLMTRRSSFASIIAIGAAALAGKGVDAQEQTVGNNAQIVSTGDVHLGQEVAASQSVIVRDGNGNIVRGAGQTVYNDGQIVSTGDVWVDQSASASQSVEGTGSGGCTPGFVFADPDNGRLYYFDRRCNACPVPAPKCSKGCR